MADDRARFPAVGVAGCGAMGLPMARRLAAAGFDTTGFDVRAVAEFDDFSEHMESDPVRFAGRCEIVISVVRDERQTHDLLFDEQAICTSPAAIRTVVLSSTLAPRVVERVRQRLDADIALLDAPMSGAPAGAEAGELTFMIGGADSEVDRCLPMFHAMGSACYCCGPLGQGMTVKVLNNYVAVSSVLSVRRVLDAADRLGVDGAHLREIMSKSSGATWYGDRFDVIDWARQGHDEGNTIGILEKDLAAALDAMSPVVDFPALDDALFAGLRRLVPYTGR